MDELALKDIHLPNPIGWWPPAAGWWLLAIALPLLSLAIYWLYQHLNRDNPVKTARRLLNDLKQLMVEDPGACIGIMSALLRRVAISGDRRPQVAKLHGQEWLNYLDYGLDDAPFSTGIGQILADAHYRPTLPPDFDLPALFALCERWLRQQEKRRC